MDFESFALLNAAVMIVVDRIRAVVPKIQGAWTNLTAAVVGTVAAILFDLGGLVDDVLPALADDAELVKQVAVGVLVAAGSGLIDQLRQIGAGQPGPKASVDGQQ